MKEATTSVDCNYCGKPARYHLGRWGYYWECLPCGARVGCHGNSLEPLGILANAELRGQRIVLHNMFDHLWKSHRPRSRQVERNRRYKWLARKMGIKNSKCHFAMFTLDQCKEAKEIIRAINPLPTHSPVIPPKSP
jgi:hypothetical protein